MIKAAIETILTIVLLIVGSNYAIKKVHDQIKIMALTKVHKGLTSLSKFTQSLTR
jgi:hypothetical protein